MYLGQTRPMAGYERQIRYLDFWENGQRMRGAGFIKLERQDNLCSISLQISGLYRKDRLVRPLLIKNQSQERELCKLELADGGIKFYLDQLDCENLDGSGICYNELTGIRIPISENKEICCTWGMFNRAECIVKGEVVQAEGSELQEVNLHRDLPEELRESENLREPEEPKELKKPEQERLIDDTSVRDSAVIMDNKWEQLWAIYPHTTPFSDGREYLSMGPSDFVILAEQHYKLVNNSFLLHGYYNYHHLILTRLRERNQMRYYIGVPGIFMEREKKTAIMFGFQSFECAVEPAQEGDFGYYMMPVEL